MKNHHPKFSEQLFFYLSGAFVSAPLPSFYRLLDDKLANVGWDSLVLSFVVSTSAAPFVEEFVKAYPLFYRHGETEKSLFRLGFLTGLGFGTAEFFIYVLIHHTPVIDRLPGLFFHATNTSIVAYGISKNQAIKYYLIAIVLHAANNYFANFGTLWYFGGVAAILTSYILSYILSHKTTEKEITYWN